jgi:RimJ/RimL family protein N-acetyltransferase
VKPENLYKQIREFKRLENGSLNTFSIPISGPNGKTFGWFAPITINSLSDEKLIQKLTEWRSIHRTCFFTQFDPTQEKTKNWLKEDILIDDSRILFIIFDSDGNPIGNYGLRDIHETKAELDNLLIGDPSGKGPLVLIAMKAFLNWSFSQFGFTTLKASIFKHNLTTIYIHKRLGFEEIKEIPVRKIIHGSVIQYKYDEKIGSTPDAYIIEMQIEFKNIK